MKIQFANFNSFGANGNRNPEPDGSSESREARQRMVHSIESRLAARRSRSEKVADWLVRWGGSVGAIVFHVLFFTAWILINIGLIPTIRPFDPFPFILLTMVVSLEAIFLALFVLISQNRESRISNLREEVDIQINMIAEQEITKVIRLVAHLMKHLNVPYEKDPELKRMMKPLDTEEIERELGRQLNLPHQK
ncbi:MAG: DUF1003 domain-containing protein [Parcubacteria group bacterium]|nr:DUF1003 domain-containing protein [Parcubacteria group bacterium]